MCVCVRVQHLKMASYSTDSSWKVLYRREIGAMKMLSSRIALRCDKHQFCDKMTECLKSVFEYRCLNKVVVSSVWLLGTYMGLADHKGTQRGRLSAYINKRICSEVIQYSIYYRSVPSRVCRLSDRLVYTILDNTLLL